MKCITKSIYLKIIAIAVFISCFGVGTFLISDIASDYNTSLGLHYQFEREFKDSDMARMPLNTLCDVLISWINGELTEKEIQGALSEYNDKAAYSAEINGLECTNIGADENVDFNTDYSLCIEQTNGNLKVTRGSNNPYYTAAEFPEEDFSVRITLLSDYVEEASAIWYGEKDTAEKAIYISTALLLLVFLSFAYLAWACGGREFFIDKMYSEVTIFLIFMIGFAAMGILLVTIGIVSSMSSPFYSLIVASSCGVALLSGAALGLSLSVVRNIKSKMFAKRFLVYKIVKYFLKSLSFKASVIFNVLLLIYTVIVFLLSIFMTEEFFFGFLLMLALFIGACCLIIKGTEDFEKIRTGIKEIKNGNAGYKIKDIHIEILKAMAENINSIGDGIAESVEQGIKAERMKSELITNVSHDLKTPLTSIISYADLLCKEELKPEEANDYAKIIREKSERLKNLTSDLFDISKVQSGNEVIETEALNIALLINQSVGEADAQIKEAGLDFVLNIPDEEIIVCGDGKKLSRAFENLVLNAVKYSMKNTRVYIDVKKSKGKCVVEMKNISEYPLNFDCEEITERFVRGDLSRSTEGSGLGLAIAKSYVEACGGSFKISTDGDLFKATIKL